MEKLILVSGKANSGKDTFIDMTIEYLESKGYKCVKLAFAKYLKDLCRDHMGWSGDKDIEGRTLLQYIGTDIIRDKLNWQAFHVNRVCEDIQIIGDQYDFVFVSDARFANELYHAKSVFLNKCTDLLIDRPSLVSELDGKQLAHKSENALGDYRHAYYIANIGDLEDLKLLSECYCSLMLEVKCDK